MTQDGVHTDTGAAGNARDAFRLGDAGQPAHLGEVARLAGRDAVEVSGDGAHVVLSDRRSVLDFGSYAVTLLGHRHPAVVDAVRHQLDTMTVSTRTLANPVTAAAAAELVDRLTSYHGGVYFGLNGADAVEFDVDLVAGMIEESLEELKGAHW